MNDLPKVLFVDDEESVLKGIELNLGRKYDAQPQYREMMHLSLLKRAIDFR